MRAESAGRTRDDAKLRAEIATGLAAAEALAPEWSALWDACPWATTFQRPAWVLAFLRHLAGGEPRVVVVREGTRLVGLLPLAPDRDDPRTWTIAGTGPSDVLDLLAAPPREDAIARAALSQLAASRGWSALELHELRETSPLLAAVRSGGAGHVVVDAPLSVCPTLSLRAGSRSLAESLPARWAERVAHDLRASARRGLRIVAADPARGPQHVETWRRLHGARWASRSAPGVLATRERFDDDVFPALLADGHALALELHDRDGVPRASCMFLLERRRAASYLGGFDPAIAGASPLVVLLGAAIGLLAARGTFELDFLRGSEPYKYQWGAVDRPQRRVRVESRAPERDR